MSLPPSAPEASALPETAGEGAVPGLAELARERLPSRDLWAGIESRITAPQRALQRHREPSHWPYALAASVVAALVTGVLLKMPDSSTASPTRVASVGVDEPASQGFAASRSKPYDNRQGEPRHGDASPRGLRLLRSESLDNAPVLVAERAVSPDSGLMKATYSTRGHDNAHAQQAIVRANLRLATQAEREVRRALKTDPDSQSLHRLLVSAQQQRERLTSLLIHDPG